MRWIGKKNKKVELYEWEKFFLKEKRSNDIIKIAILDVETTGLKHLEDEIIELGVVIAEVDKNTGELISVVSEHNFQQAVDFPLSPEITRITGLTNKDLNGKSIDWSFVDKLLEDVELIIAHNAFFDRPFVEKYSETAKIKSWACSFAQIDWHKWSFPEKSQKNLCIYHGFFYEAHRALSDCQALLHLLSHTIPEDEKTYLKILIDQLEECSFLVIATKTQYNKKFIFNEKKYSWNQDFALWFKNYDNQKEAEEDFFHIKENVYGFENDYVKLIKLPAHKKFKSMSVLKDENFDEKYLKEYVILAINTEYETKELLKSRSYEFDFVKNINKKAFFKFINKDELNEELDWLRNNVYQGSFQGKIYKNPYKK